MRRIRNAVTLVVDGREVVAPEGTMLVDAAQHGDIEIPVFCYEPKLGEPVGACRMCLVEIEGIPKLQTACSTPVRDGMVVYTQTDEVKTAQEAVVEFLLVNHPLDCPVCDKGGECPLQDISMGWGPGRNRFTDPKRHFQKPLELSPLIAIDRERCILCYRCVRFSQEVAEDEQLQLLDRGDRSYVGTFDDRPYIAPFHGNITELCPVGALTSYTYRFRARPWDIEDAGSVCTLCPSQCNVRLTVRDERVMRVLARDNTDVDDGWLCDKGRYGFQMADSEERITEPMIREGGSLRPASWEEALERVAAGLREAGSRAAALVQGGSTNEEGWLAQRIVRRALGSPHVDSRSGGKVAREALVEASRPELGAKVACIDSAEAILVLECDPLHEAPILDLRIRKAMRRFGTRLAVASPRPTTLDGGAAEVVRYAPGEGAALLRALAAALGAEGYPDGGPHAEPATAIARTLGAAEDVVVVWGERLIGGPDGGGALADLLAVARALGLERRHEAGMLAVPEHANGRGLREVGCLPTAGPGLAETAIGTSAAEIRRGLEDGKLGALLLLDSDPVRHHPDGEGWRRALAAADLVVSMTMFEDSSAALADVVLPAEAYPEKEGTVTHTDGRLQRLRPGVPRPGAVRSGWRILAELCAMLGDDPGLETAPAALAALAEEVPFYAGITHEEIGGTGIRWQERPAAAALGRSGAPAPGTSPDVGAEGASTYGDEAEGRVAPSPGPGVPGRPQGRPPGAGAPRPGDTKLTLGTHRDLWATGVTERNPALRFLAPAQRLEISPDDAARLGISHGDPVTVSASGSSVEATAAIASRMQPGAVFLIEGTAHDNANLLLVDGGPQTVSIARGER